MLCNPHIDHNYVTIIISIISLQNLFYSDNISVCELPAASNSIGECSSIYWIIYLHNTFTGIIKSCIMKICTHRHMHVCIHTCAYTHACIRTCMHTYIHAYMHTYIHAYMHTYIHAAMLPCNHHNLYYSCATMQTPLCDAHSHAHVHIN